MSLSLQEQAGALVAELRRGGLAGAGLLAVLEAAVRARPEDDAVAMARCLCLWEQGARAAAIEAFGPLLRRRPDDAGLRAAMGTALFQDGRRAEGVALFRALDADGEAGPGALNMLAQVLWDQGEWDESIAVSRRVVAARPEDADAHFHLAQRLLATGQYAEGWAEYAWRWGLAVMPDGWRRPRAPLERPDPAEWAGKTVLVYAEQGFGDTLQCLRFVPMVARLAGRVVLEVPPGLLRLARTVAPGVEVVGLGAATGYDRSVPIFHLPWALGITLDTLPAAVPYLAADPDAVAGWRARLAGLSGRKVGLIWAGAPRPLHSAAAEIDRRRSIPPEKLAGLAEVPGVTLVSLQKGAAATGVALVDWTAELTDFADTAALMEALDLVIAVDTGPMHLAAALGRPVWMLNRHDSCWRWLLGREDSPWYPTLRQFRQAAPGDWDAVVGRVVVALRML
jgi:hypothetical protein